jgi:hypothetical protein
MMNPNHQREFIGQAGKCSLCGGPLGNEPAFAHEKAGRVHLRCSFRPERWRAWMERTGMVPQKVKVEVVDNEK